MAEISYPFTADSAGGGQQMVSQAQWHHMASMWGGDRIDFTLTSDSYASGILPFSAAVINGRTVEIQPGRAWVGGFYYQLTSSTTLAIEPNPTDKARKDTIVLRADVVGGSVNLVAVKGQPSASPIAPLPQRNPGVVWEMVLYEVDVPAQDGAVAPNLRAPFKTPPAVALPWNVRNAADFLPVGSFLYDMDNNGGDSQFEAWKGRDGYVVARHFGKSRTYLPVLTGAASVPPSAMLQSGRWRWIAPGVVYFSVHLENRTTGNINVASGGNTIGFTLPHSAIAATGQVFSGFLRNPEENGSYPNSADVKGMVFEGSSRTTVSMYIPSPSNPAQGLDSMVRFPARSHIYFSGIYEADVFGG